jgi:hypothetical protein
MPSYRGAQLKHRYNFTFCVCVCVCRPGLQVGKGDLATSDISGRKGPGCYIPPVATGTVVLSGSHQPIGKGTRMAVCEEARWNGRPEAWNASSWK